MRDEFIRWTEGLIWIEGWIYKDGRLERKNISLNQSVKHIFQKKIEKEGEKTQKDEGESVQDRTFERKRIIKEPLENKEWQKEREFKVQTLLILQRLRNKLYNLY